MNPLVACPTSDRLNQLINGQLPAREVDALVEHLNECAHCIPRDAKA